MSRFMKVFFALSVIVNLLLAGLVIGHMGRCFMEPHKHFTMQEIAMALPDDTRHNFEEVMDRAEHDTGELRQQLIDARNKSATLLKAEPFDKSAYLQQMQEIHTLHGPIMEHMAAAVAQVAEQSTPHDRAILADMLRYAPRPKDD